MRSFQPAPGAINLELATEELHLASHPQGEIIAKVSAQDLIGKTVCQFPN